MILRDSRLAYSRDLGRGMKSMSRSPTWWPTSAGPTPSEAAERVAPSSDEPTAALAVSHSA